MHKLITAIILSTTLLTNVASAGNATQGIGADTQIKDTSLVKNETFITGVMLTYASHLVNIDFLIQFNKGTGLSVHTLKALRGVTMDQFVKDSESFSDSPTTQAKMLESLHEIVKRRTVEFTAYHTRNNKSYK